MDTNFSGILMIYIYKNNFNYSLEINCKNFIFLNNPKTFPFPFV